MKKHSITDRNMSCGGMVRPTVNREPHAATKKTQKGSRLANDKSKDPQATTKKHEKFK